MIFKCSKTKALVTRTTVHRFVLLSQLSIFSPIHWIKTENIKTVYQSGILSLKMIAALQWSFQFHRNGDRGMKPYVISLEKYDTITLAILTR